MEKDYYFVVKFLSIAGELILSDAEMKQQDWQDMKHDIKSIRMVLRTKKWKEALPEFDP